MRFPDSSTDDNGLYYMRARYYNVNIKRFINQDVVHGSINVSQSLNRYSYVQGNPIKLTDPFGLSPLDKINWRNVGHSALNIQGCINGYGFIFDGINAVWYACEGDYGMAALSLISALSDTGNMIAFGLKSTKFARVGQYIGAITQLVSNAATFTQAAISGLENAKAIFRNAKSGKLLSIDTASNVAALGLNLFTTIVSGKGAVTSGKNIKKMIGTDVGNKWGNKANNKPLLECNLQFFAKKNGGKTRYGKSSGKISKKSILKNNMLPTTGKIRFVPQKGWTASQPLKRINGEFVDRFDNVWTKGPSITAGEPFEWDVQLSKTGREKLGWLSRDNSHLNVSLKGEITHK